MPPKFGGAPLCPVCRRAVYGFESSKRYFDKDYHEECFKCKACEKKITGDVAAVNGDAYHANCFKRVFTESGGKLGGQPVVKAPSCIDGEIKAAEERASAARDAVAKAQRDCDVADRALQAASAKASAARQALADAQATAATTASTVETLRRTRDGRESLSEIKTGVAETKTGGRLYECDPTKELLRDWGDAGIAGEPTTIPQALRHRVKLFGDLDVMRWKNAPTDEKWQTNTLKEFHAEVCRIAKALVALGVERHGAINILAFNSPHWFKVTLGAIFAGGMCAGIYLTNNAAACQYVINHSQCRVLFLDSAMQLAKIKTIQANCPNLKWLVMWGKETPSGDDKPANLLSWEEFLARGDFDDLNAVVEERVAAQRPGNACFLSYTSGTTGPPKAVMLNHYNIQFGLRHVFNAAAGVAFKTEERILSYLPLCHVAGALDIFGVALMWDGGHFIYHFAFPDVLQGSLVVSLRDVRPTWFVGVPRVWEKLQAGLTAGLASKGFGPAIEEGKLREALQAAGISGSTLLGSIGLDEVKFALVGAAPTQTSTITFFDQLGMWVHDTYGMTENTALSHLNTFTKKKLRSVGMPGHGNEAKLAPETNEILTKSRATMMGYMHNPQATEDAIDRDGWLHTGDVGQIGEDGFWHIVGRLKEMIISAGGENIAPIMIEDELKRQLPPISNAVVIGDRQKYLIVLVTLKQKPNGRGGFTGELEGEAVAVDSSCTTVEQAQASATWKAYLEAGMERANGNAISRAQETRKIVALNSDFSPIGSAEGEAEFTATLKLRRNVVHRKFLEVIKGQYGADYVECGW